VSTENSSYPIAAASSAPLVAIEDLRVEFAADTGTVTAVDGLCLTIERGETLAVVGESGSGKSVTALALLRLLPQPNGKLTGGRIRFEGVDLGPLSDAAMRRVRGVEIGMIFQEPMTSLNPVLTIGEQIAERLRVHAGLGRRAALARAVELLDRVRIPEPARRAGGFPHQLSGGMRQRVMIAIALACGPKLLIADEPTTALDVTIQAQILELLRQLQAEFGMAILFITHDLGVVAELADRVVVMYAGRAVEEAPVQPLFAAPRMPYTQALLRSIPRVDRAAASRGRLAAIRGNVPDARDLPAGCSFHPRCAAAQAACVATIPRYEEIAPGHRVRCRRWREFTGEAASGEAFGVTTGSAVGAG
jgi:oligopeptide/dipeptide ABC transporter ATP-binding protein